MAVEKHRYEWIVPLRVFAAVAVVLLHTIHGWIDNIENPWGGRTSLVNRPCFD